MATARKNVLYITNETKKIRWNIINTGNNNIIINNNNNNNNNNRIYVDSS